MNVARRIRTTLRQALSIYEELYSAPYRSQIRRAYLQERDLLFLTGCSDLLGVPHPVAFYSLELYPEILEHFQWITEQQSRELGGNKKSEVSQELADAFIYLVRLADQLDIDLLDSVDKKLKVNEGKYPADRVRGSHKKYSDYD